MSEELKIALDILLADLLKAGDDYLPKAYAAGKGYAAAKSGFDIEASKIDADILSNSVAFNAGKLDEMLKKMGAEILSLNPSAYDSVDAYMEDVDRIFNKYANRKHAWSYYAEQPFFDGFLQGSKEAQVDMGREMGERAEDIGFFWRTANDERVCSICWGLNGQWFGLDWKNLEVTWTAHVGCRCPEYFEYGIRPKE